MNNILFRNNIDLDKDILFKIFFFKTIISNTIDLCENWKNYVISVWY